MVSNEKSQIGLIGLAVMGQNLVLNLLDHHFSVSVYNRTYSRTVEFCQHHDSKYQGRLQGFEEIKAFVLSLERPRRIILLVKAGTSVDETISSFIEFLEPGDIVIDGGNSYFEDSLRREKELAQRQIHFVGCGVSGGEEGARHGPSMMPGGSEHAKEHLLSIFQAIAARDWAGGPCCAWIGPEGSGHFVKMVHNGIEYSDMQLICETYDVMRRGLEAGAQDCQRLFESWRKGSLDSYLIDITAQILARKDDDGAPLVDKIRDEAGQKGTGRWTVQEALNLGVPLTLISDAVFARQLSGARTLREAIRTTYQDKPSGIAKGSSALTAWQKDLELALYAAKVISYAQGLNLMAQVSRARDWNLNLSEIARIWSGGCIIRSRFLKDINQAYSQSQQPVDLLTADFVVKELPQAIASLRKVVGLSVSHGVPCASLSSALAYYDTLISQTLPANLLQAQRDYFGAHTYQRVDRSPDEYFHTDWAGTGGKVSSSTYNA